MTDESVIVTHRDPAARDRSNYILRLDLTDHGLPGHFEQVWTRRLDDQDHELCCIPFFPYNVSLGDTVRLTDPQGAYTVVAKGGHRTIRAVVLDEVFRHERHEELHASLARTGVAMEFRGHAQGYVAIDIVEQQQADAVVRVLHPLVENSTLVWEWADPVRPG